jgi:hypothetical protein
VNSRQAGLLTKIHSYPFMLGGYMNVFDFFHNAGDGIEIDKFI